MDEDGEPPPELSLAWMCQTWHALPAPGGVLEQDARQMSTMSGLLNITEALRALRNSNGAQIHNLTDGQRSILGYLHKLGLLFNG